MADVRASIKFFLQFVALANSLTGYTLRVSTLDFLNVTVLAFALALDGDRYI